MTEIDLLSVYESLPKGQEYSVIGCIEPDKNHFTVMCLLEFLKKTGVIKKINDVDLDDFADFKQINAEFLYDKYGNAENIISMYKYYGAYPTETKARNVALGLKNESMPGNVYVQKAGAWVPFNPPDNLIDNTTCSDKKMNELMNQDIKNKERTRQLMEDQKKALLKKKSSNTTTTTTKKKNIVDLQMPSKKDAQLMNTIQSVMNMSEELMGKESVSQEFKDHYKNVQGAIENADKEEKIEKPEKKDKLTAEEKIKILKIDDVDKI